MPDSQRLQAERAVQPIFSKSRFFSGLLVAALAIAAHREISRLHDREATADARAEVRFEPVTFASDSALPLRIAGAWRVRSSEPRLGGISALALDRGQLLALTDSGVVIRLPRPGRGRRIALFHDLPDGPGPARFKAGRDSEALARDWLGRGWWVAFENRHSAWLYDRDFGRVQRRIDLGALGWRANKGAEGALSARRGLLLFPESGDEMVWAGARGLERIALDNRYGRLADVTWLADGRAVLLARTYSPAGFSARLVLLEGTKLRSIARLRLGRLDNPEAIAAELLPGGNTRLWVMTDNDLRRRVPTLLIALDWAS